MGQVRASSSIIVGADAQRTLTAIADYENVRPKILTEHYREYRVVEGGQGSGTVAQWILQATQKRSRDIRAQVTVDGNTITERDENSTLVTTWTVSEVDTGSRVTMTTTWQGASGIGGIFEGIFAPLGLRKIQDAVLAKLRTELG